MKLDYESLKNKTKNFLLEKGYNVSIQPTIDLKNNPLVIDLYAKKGNDVYLIEINNGIRVGMNNISQLLKYSSILRKEENNKVHEIIITDKQEEVDPEVKKITDKEKIKIITFNELKEEGLPFS